MFHINLGDPLFDHFDVENPLLEKLSFDDIEEHANTVFVLRSREPGDHTPSASVLFVRRSRRALCVHSSSEHLLLRGAFEAVLRPPLSPYARCPVLTQRVSGTDIALASARPTRCPPPIVLRARSAVSGTDIAYDARRGVRRSRVALPVLSESAGIVLRRATPSPLLPTRVLRQVRY
eukprot:1863421-Rhodomonas_salina.1